MLLVDGIKKTVGISKISFLGCFYLYGSSQFQWLLESLLEFSSLPHFGMKIQSRDNIFFFFFNVMAPFETKRICTKGNPQIERNLRQIPNTNQ